MTTENETQNDDGVQATAVDHDVQTQCGYCEGTLFESYEKDGEIVALECANCCEVFEL